MKYLIYLICLLPLCGSGQISWQKLNTTDLNVIESPQVFVIDSDAYLVGGRDSFLTALSSVWQYRIESNTWLRKQNFDSIFGGGGTAIGNNGYVISGDLNYRLLNHTCSKYDAFTDSWANIAPIPESRFYGVSFSAMGRLYTCLGFDSLGGDLNTTWEYDPQLNRWRQRASMPGLVRVDASVAVKDSFAYIVGGRHFDSLSNGYSTNEFWRYNVVHDKWDSMPPIPGLPRAGAVAYAFSHFIIVGFGLYQNTAIGIMDSNITDMYRFDFTTSSWNPVIYTGAVVPSGYGCYFKYMNKCYLYEGQYNNNSMLGRGMYEFDATPLIEAYSDVQEVARDIQGLRVYPNPIGQEQSFIVESDEIGFISFYNTLGQHVSTSTLSPGINNFDCMHIGCGSNFLFYKAEMQGGKVITGKLSIIK